MDALNPNPEKDDDKRRIAEKLQIVCFAMNKL
jgi:hypothetical protein